jgi:hypothetical protein
MPRFVASGRRIENDTNMHSTDDFATRGFSRGESELPLLRFFPKLPQ